MSGAKETPRQKMIGMMYLVLTALLALNVSVEVLDAFTTVNDGLENTYISVDKKIVDYYNTFEQQYNKQPEKTAKYWDKAQEIRQKTDEFVNFIERDIKLALLIQNNGVTEEELLNPEKEEDAVILDRGKADAKKNRRVFHRVNFDNIKGKDKHDAVTAFMIEQGNAEVLRKKIEEYRQYVIETLKASGIVNFENHVGLVTDGQYYAANGESLTWEMKNFNQIIIPAAISIINEIVGEVQTIEYDAITELYKNIGASDFKFNTLEAKVFPKTTYVLKGQDFEADVFIVASDDTKEFNAKYAKGVKDFSRASDNAINEVSSTQGVIKIKVPANAEGEQSIAGVVEMKNPLTGEVEPYPFNTSYTVAPPSANVTPTKMNVMYRGLENPIAISAPGFTANQINVDVTNGELIKGNNGEYFVKPGNEGNITTVVVSTMIDGKRMVLDNCDFRLKRTPDPVPVLNGKTNDKFTKEEILAAGGFVLTMPDFDFEGYHSQILSYDVSTIVGGYLKPIKGIKGRKFNKDVEDLVKSARRGQRITIENIKVKSPDGEERILNTPITIELKN
jgi:gliding motility-associated protein GldM